MQQDAQKKYLEPEPSVEMLAAMVNNNIRCYNESMEFAERVEETLDDDHKVRMSWCFKASVSLWDSCYDASIGLLWKSGQLCQNSAQILCNQSVTCMSYLLTTSRHNSFLCMPQS